MKTGNQLVGTGLLTALAASLCCITPFLALVAGAGGIASSFSWLEPYRPYLISITVVVLVYAWYQKLKQPAPPDCNCETETNSNFMQSKTFLSLITAFALLMLTFPNYAETFYPAPKKQITQVSQEKSKTQTAEFKITGMSCAACEHHVTSEVNKIPGILNLKVSYANANAIVEFDKSKTTVEQVQKAIKTTGYKVVETKIKQ